jgi:aromatic ring-opening dioxygenase catalytic subunit (LigB family)
MIYDYYGFPDFTYQIRYDAPGDPGLAARVEDLIEAAGLPAGSIPSVASTTAPSRRSR